MVEEVMRTVRNAKIIFSAFIMIFFSHNGALARCIIKCVTIHVHIDPPHVNIPKVNLPGGLVLTPGGVVPAAVAKKADDVLNKAVTAAVPAANAILEAGAKAVDAQAAPLKALGKVVAGESSLGSAASNIIHTEGQKYAAIGEAISEANAANKNIQVIAAESIGGNVGKTVMTISTGVDRYTVEFAATGLILGGNVLQGIPPDRILAAPLAAALRSAEKQFLLDSKPLPQFIIDSFKGKYPDDVLSNARYAVGGISISAPDLINSSQKIVYGDDNAVTVGRVTVFSTDPGQETHWWAHELQHQVQYKNWGIDEFAYKYITNCHSVESDAEDEAQKVVPLAHPNRLLC
jgi:Domain of unknown function (DUF4157)